MKATPQQETHFLRATGGICSNCHQYQGRGSEIGPDLTQIHRRATKRWLLESILQPSRELSPRFMPITILKKDGRTLTGLEIEGPGEDDHERLLTSEGKFAIVKTSEIQRRNYLTSSIMPSGLDQALSVEELRDLIAFLMQPPRH